MSIRIVGNQISGVGRGITVPDNSIISIESNVLTRCRTAIEVRDPVSLFSVLGLDKEATAKEVAELLRAIDGASSQDSATNVAHAMGAERLLSVGSDLSTVISSFWQLKESGLAKQVLALFGQA